jgi:hypothetical protein
MNPQTNLLSYDVKSAITYCELNHIFIDLYVGLDCLYTYIFIDAGQTMIYMFIDFTNNKNIDI